MITISASKAYPGCAVISGSQCEGVITLDELEQLKSIRMREEICELIKDLESPIDKCERASERMRVLAQKAPETKRSPKS